ncbi:MAG: large subunit ribosomal protein [Moorella sp. (in: firmicutes)]|uniref:Large ribosomal subunit protein bL28 n=1 Tax=Neomoorella thermoacetica TaxID=1525 RepID=A0A1J5NHS8_NEOTH|nr:large subunit ribosomal protein [Moorella sp. (in: firmicutes)]OIQ58402.1 50S ribosomal protein L28 [Moorella thermoacetica]
MATCNICGKRAVTGNQVSHSNIKTKRTWAPNLQRVKLLVNGTPRRAYVCTRCLRSGKVQRAI